MLLTWGKPMTTHTASGQRREWVLSMLDRYEIPLTRYAKRLLGDEDAARDVVQHAFVRLCDQSPEDLQGRVGPWLYTVCRNKAVDWMRARRRTASLEDAELLPCNSREPDPAALAERHDLYVRVNQVVERLPGHQREAITLWSEGLRYREIAEITGTTEGNCRVLIHRALKALRQHPLARHLLAGPECPDVPLPRPSAEVST
jgi:RNA polymerase sigma-70 factor, ECF subfamily